MTEKRDPNKSFGACLGWMPEDGPALSGLICRLEAGHGQARKMAEYNDIRRFWCAPREPAVSSAGECALSLGLSRNKGVRNAVVPLSTYAWRYQNGGSHVGNCRRLSMRYDTAK